VPQDPGRGVRVRFSNGPDVNQCQADFVEHLCITEAHFSTSVERRSSPHFHRQPRGVVPTVLDGGLAFSGRWVTRKGLLFLGANPAWCFVRVCTAPERSCTPSGTASSARWSSRNFPMTPDVAGFAVKICRHGSRGAGEAFDIVGRARPGKRPPREPTRVLPRARARGDTARGETYAGFANIKVGAIELAT